MIHQSLFRVARLAPARWNVIKTALQVIVFWSTFLYFLPQAVLWFVNRFGIESPQQHLPQLKIVAVVVFALASCIGLWSAWVIASMGQGTPLPVDCPRKLVVYGPYRFVRNPMALTGLTQGTCVALWYGSWSLVLYVFFGFLAWNYIARPLEERDLDQRFGDEFREYQTAVRCWIPRLSPYKPHSGSVPSNANSTSAPAPS